MAEPKYKVGQNVMFRSQVMRIESLFKTRTGDYAVVEDIGGACWSTRVSNLSPVPNTVDDMVRHMLELRRADGLVYKAGYDGFGEHECSCSGDDLLDCMTGTSTRHYCDECGTSCVAAKLVDGEFVPMEEE